MNTIEEIEEAVRRLSSEKQAEFRAWYAEFDADQWDRQLEADVADGKLDWLIKEAKEENKNGRCTER